MELFRTACDFAWKTGEAFASAAETAQPYFSSAWGTVKKISKFLEPYQPAIATGLIVGKLSWRAYKYKPLISEINALTKHIQPLERTIRGLEHEPNFSRQRLESAKSRLAELKAERTEKQRQLDLGKLTLGQIPSLFFSHPGNNLWNSAQQLVNRSVSLKNDVHPVSPQAASTLKVGACALAGMISLAGTTTSVLRQIGAVSADNPSAHMIVGLAMAVGIIESAWIAKNSIQSYLNNRAEQRARTL